MPPKGWRGGYKPRVKTFTESKEDFAGGNGTGNLGVVPGSGDSKRSDPPVSGTPSGSSYKPSDSVRPVTKTGNNLEKDKPTDKPVKVAFDIEKLKAAFPKFMRLAFKAANNIFRVLALFPFVPFKITFEDLSPEEEELFKEAAWPGFEAALPAAAKKHPIAFLSSAVALLTLGKINLEMKPKPPAKGPSTPKPEEKKKEEGQ